MIGDPRGWGRVRARDDTGAIAIFAAIFISFVALVLMAFVMDLGQVYSTQQRLQDAADSASWLPRRITPTLPRHGRRSRSTRRRSTARPCRTARLPLRIH